MPLSLHLYYVLGKLFYCIDTILCYVVLLVGCQQQVSPSLAVNIVQ